MTKNREGTQYVSIVEGYRDKDKVKQRTIKSLGKLKELEAGNPNYLSELKEDVKAGKFQPEPETLSLTLDLNKKYQIHSKTTVGSFWMKYSGALGSQRFCEYIKKERIQKSI